MSNSALLIIDAQKEYFAPYGQLVLPDGPQALTKINTLLNWARTKQIPVIHIVHHTNRPNYPYFVPGSVGVEIHQEIIPTASEHIISKHKPGSFTGTRLTELLQELAVNTLILCGYTEIINC